MSIETTLAYIHNVKWQGVKPGLDRTRELLQRLGNPERELRFIHIAGTNGKGSTASMISSVLKTAGYKTGLYTSPYILRFNERMQVNGEQISDAELEELTDIIRPHADAMTDSPTEFELITALAMLYFKRSGCDVVVLEVGMGGELDSTNVIPTPELAVITAMGLDHTAELGDTLAEIASAKAGIIKRDGTVVVYGEESEAYAVFVEKCRTMGAVLTRTDFSKLTIRETSLEGTRFDFGSIDGMFVPLAGVHQPKNAALAITAIKALVAKGYAISDENIREGIAAARWPGRFEVLRRSPLVIADGAHNPHGIASAVESIKLLLGGKRPVFVIGVMADKDVRHMTESLVPLAKAFIAVTPSVPRAMKAKELAGLLAGYGAEAEAYDDIQTGVDRALELAGEDGAVVALGSLYFAADVRNSVQRGI